MFDLNQYPEEQLKDPEFKKTHEESQEEYEVIWAEIAARCSQDVTQEELARRTGTRQSNISRIESGACSPRISTLQKTTDALGMKLCTELHKKSSWQTKYRCYNFTEIDKCVDETSSLYGRLRERCGW